MSSSSSSASVLSSSSRRIQEKNENPPLLTGMDLKFQQLEERIIAERTTTSTTCTNTNTQVPVLPSIIDVIGCEITIDDIQSAKRELLTMGVDLKKDVNQCQLFNLTSWKVAPLIHCCLTGNLLIIKLLFLIGADCNKLCEVQFCFPMLVAAREGHLDICKWLYEYGGDVKYQINKETNDASNGVETPLRNASKSWDVGIDKEGKTCRWLLLNGGGQHLSTEAMDHFWNRRWDRRQTDSKLLFLWMRENIQLHDAFMLLLSGTTTMITSSSSSLLLSEPNDDGTRKHTRKRKIHPERSLQILDGHPGIMELVGNYVGLIRGKEFRMLKEFNELVIKYNNTY